MRFHRNALVRIAVAMCGAVLAVPVASASDWSNLLREVRKAERASVDAPPPLSAEDATRIWDAFLTAIVKRAGRDAASELLRDDLLFALLEDRYGVIEAAASGDGARWLADHFGAVWPRIETLLDRVAVELPPEQATAYRDLLAKARVLDRARELGLVGEASISSGTLRELAHRIVPADAGDPLAWSTGVDSEMRAIFGFEAELPEPVASPLLALPPTALLASPFALLARAVEGAGNWLVPSAHAAASPWDWHTLVTRLNEWIPSSEGEMREYLPMMREMLDGTAHTLGSRRLPPEDYEVYRNLVVATAWQESCWRQYVRKAGQVAPVVGPGPSFGLMQINTRAWRGLYDARGVSTDIGYNGRAGAEILLQYMRRHALRAKEHLAPGGHRNLARATYAAYNGGPAHLRRYRTPDTPPQLRAVDAEFWRKFQAVERGDEAAFLSCAVRG